MTSSPGVDRMLLGYVIEGEADPVTVCIACANPDADEAPEHEIRDNPVYGATVPYPECWVCQEVMRPERLEGCER